MNDPDAKKYLDLAARVASRAFGHAEPNPMVGAVIVKDAKIIGIGHHRRFGDLHAERDALAGCVALGHDPRGATMYCTLEPCSHHGKQPPCTEAVIAAGIARVVIASRDPHTLSRGGWDVLAEAGVKVELSDGSANAIALSQPFLHRLRTDRPWVIAKWAQTIDGRIATRTGESQWISGARCRARVHRLRAKVDAVLVGIGTALADDPMLTARDCRSVRRVAKRVVLDTHGRLPTDSRLVRTAGEVATIVFTAESARLGARLAGTGCVVEETATRGAHLDLSAVLETLARDHGVATVLMEAGPRVLGAMLEEGLIDDAVVHVAPAVMGDARARAVAEGRDVATLDGMRRFGLRRVKRVGDDVELWYRSG